MRNARIMRANTCHITGATNMLTIMNSSKSVQYGTAESWWIWRRMTSQRLQHIRPIKLHKYNPKYQIETSRISRQNQTCDEHESLRFVSLQICKPEEQTVSSLFRLAIGDRACKQATPIFLRCRIYMQARGRSRLWSVDSTLVAFDALVLGTYPAPPASSTLWEYMRKWGRTFTITKPKPV